MVVYAAASAAARLPDQADPRQGAAAPARSSALVAALVIGFYVCQGPRRVLLVLPDGRRRAAGRARPAQPALRGTSSASRRASSRGAATGQLLSRITNDVGQVQQAVSETVGDLLRESLALVGYAGAAVLLRRAAGARVPHRARRSSSIRWSRLGQRVRRTTRRSQEALEHLSHVSAEAFTGHRIVKAFGAEEREAAKFAAASRAAVPHEHEGDARRCRSCRR